MSASSLKITPFRAISNTLLHIFVVYLSFLWWVVCVYNQKSISADVHVSQDCVADPWHKERFLQILSLMNTGDFPLLDNIGYKLFIDVIQCYHVQHKCHHSHAIFR